MRDRTLSVVYDSVISVVHVDDFDFQSLAALEAGTLMVDHSQQVFVANHADDWRAEAKNVLLDSIAAENSHVSVIGVNTGPSAADGDTLG